MPELVKVVNGVPLVSTLDMWEGLQVKHVSLVLLLQRYESKFQKIRQFTVHQQKSAGRPTPFYMLDEEQAMVLISLMRNSDPVVEFKFKLGHEFYRMKAELVRLS